MLADLLALAALTLVADLTRGPGGEFSLAGRICLAAAYTTVIRLLWQFFFYLRTDLYVLVTTLLGCVDLHTTAKRMLGNRVRRGLDRVRGVFGRAPSDRPLADESAFHPIDRRIGSWYSWLMLVGYSVSLGTFVLAGAPAAYLLFSGALGRFGDGATSAQQLLDSAVFLGTNLAQLAAVGWLALLERRQRPTSQSRHVIAA